MEETSKDRYEESLAQMSKAPENKGMDYWVPVEAMNWMNRDDSRLWGYIFEGLAEEGAKLDEVVEYLEKYATVSSWLEWSCSTWRDFFTELGAPGNPFLLACKVETRVAILKKRLKTTETEQQRSYEKLDQGSSWNIKPGEREWSWSKEVVPKLNHSKPLASVWQLVKWAESVPVPFSQYPKLIRKAWNENAMENLGNFHNIVSVLEVLPVPSTVKVVQIVLRLWNKEYKAKLIGELQELRPRKGETMGDFVKHFQMYVEVLEIDNDIAKDWFLKRVPEKLHEMVSLKCLLSDSFKAMCQTLLDTHLANKLFGSEKPMVTLDSGEKPTKYSSEASERGWGSKRPRENEELSEERDKRRKMLSEIDKANRTCFKCHAYGHTRQACKAPVTECRKNAEVAIKEWNEKLNGMANQPKGSKEKNSIYVQSVSFDLGDAREAAYKLNGLELEELDKEYEGTVGEDQVQLEMLDGWHKRQETHERIKNIHELHMLTKGKLMYTNIIIQGMNMRALIDTGAQSSVIEKGVLVEVQKVHNQNMPIEGEVWVRCANDATERGELVQLEVEWEGYVKQHLLVVLERASFPVIMGMDLLSIWPVLNRPAISISLLRKELGEFKLGDLEDVLQSPIEGTVLHRDHEYWMKMIQEELTANLATATEHSTLGEVCIEFLNAEDRLRGVWRNQGSMPQKAQEFYQKQVDEWEKAGIVEQMMDTSEGEREVGPFNVRGFYIWSGKDRIVHNFKP